MLFTFTGSRLQVTEQGSRASGNSELAAIDSVARSTILQEFCMKTEGEFRGDDSYFMRGLTTFLCGFLKFVLFSFLLNGCLIGPCEYSHTATR
jgi:hypothetical protein